jgi:hypothetical protein
MSLTLQRVALRKQSEAVGQPDQAISRAARQRLERTVNFGKARHTKCGELDPNTKARSADAGQIPCGSFWQNEAKFINRINKSGG